MEHVSVGDLEVPAHAEAIDKREIGEALEATDLSLNRYELPTGDRLSGLHAHADQEEVFVVLSGEVAFETLEGVERLTAGEAIRFAPGEHKSPTNTGGDPATVIAIGAPADGGDLLIPLACPECGHSERLAAIADGTEVLRCPECGHESEASCDHCGSEAMRAVRPEDGGPPVGRCTDCGAVADH